jgi:Protein of unknown function (DUF3551)
MNVAVADGGPGSWRRPITGAYVVLLVLTVGLTIGVDRAAAQGAAWCLRAGDSSGGGCAYHTFEQCLASRAGGSSHCVQNPNYSGPSSVRPRPRR